ncbi:ABC transporter substrate-binding protein [Frisingicoccus sp.]|uniref:ABC transporter substrate-binding protein n=1 Tax=Frisingicoccus sp. TaxID=1918627 RepID=UPI002A803AFE|nr:ABC transporter substrate-binding protein [Frisingicoccus sp.]MDY4835359.1 ABC transporter substrate-binding protein [Frisingicoccus sp.]MDY4922823.1 ABC transporter substrate-binding protein [Frisingicoccus sp.]
MKFMKKGLAMVLAGAMVVASLTACGSSKKETTAETKAAETTAETTAETKEAAADGKTYKIGVLQLVEHAALDASNEGFVAALDDAGISYTIDQQNAQGDQTACQTIAEKLVNDGDDLILAIATPAAQAVAGITTEIPIVGTAITDFAASGLVESNDAPGGNVTGSSDLTPIEAQISLLQKVLPDAKTIGVLYCSAESNSAIQLEMTKEACAAAGLEVVEFSVASSNEIQSVVESAVGKVDALYSFTDNTIAAGMNTVAMVANENNLPVIVGEEGMVTAGGLCTYGIDYYELGYLAGQMAVRILTEGADPATMPIEYYPEEKCEFIGNEDTAATLGIDISGLE